MKKYIIITGASKGLGKNLSLILSNKLGFNLILCSFKKKIIKEDYQTDIIICDGNLRNNNTINKLNYIVNKFKKNIVALYLNAANTYFGEFNNSLSKHLEVVNLNINSNLKILNMALPIINNNKGKVIFISSILSNSYSPFQSSYSASKIFMEKFLDSIENEKNIKNINFHYCICGGIKTDMAMKFGWKQSKYLLDPRLASLQIISGIRKNKKKIIVGGKVDKFYNKIKYIIPDKINKYIFQNIIYKNMKNDCPRIAVIGNGNIGCWFAHKLSSVDYLKWYVRNEKKNMYFKGEKITQKQNLLNSINNKSDYYIITTPSNSQKEPWFTKIIKFGKPFVTINIGKEVNNDNHIDIGLPVLCYTQSNNVKIMKFKKILLSGKNKESVKKLCHFLNCSGIRSKQVKKVQKYVYKDALFLQIFAENLKSNNYNNYSVKNIIKNMFLYRLHSNLIFVVILIKVLNLKHKQILIEHYKRLDKQTVNNKVILKRKKKIYNYI